MDDWSLGIFLLGRTVLAQSDYSSGLSSKASKIVFVTKIYHPNINSSGSISCAPAKIGRWSPAQTIYGVLVEIRQLLTDIFADEPLVP